MVKPLTQPPQKERKNSFVPIGIIGIVVLIFFAAKPFLEKDGETWRVAKWRLKELDKKLEELNNAEQYVLIARFNNYYTCYNCKTGKIYLKKGEVWRYGVTTKGQKGRYESNFLETENVQYIVQYEGTLQSCLEEEARKIYLYPELPENLLRQEPLFLPPGNKISN